jgi:hypothetical protein
MPRSRVLVLIGAAAVMCACGESTRSAAPTTTTLPPTTTSVVTASAPTSVPTTRQVAGRVRALAGPPNAARDPSAVWSGQVLYAWFGSGAVSYTPTTDAWSALPAPSLSPRVGCVVVGRLGWPRLERRALRSNERCVAADGDGANQLAYEDVECVRGERS